MDFCNILIYIAICYESYIGPSDWFRNLINRKFCQIRGSDVSGEIYSFGCVGAGKIFSICSGLLWLLEPGLDNVDMRIQGVAKCALKRKQPIRSRWINSFKHAWVF